MDYEFFSDSLLFNDVFKLSYHKQHFKKQSGEIYLEYGNIWVNIQGKYFHIYFEYGNLPEEYGNTSRLIIFDVLGKNRDDFCPSKRP